MVSVGVSKSLHSMKHVDDPKETILKAVGDISGIEPWGVNVLIATYVRPKKTSGGILLTDKFRDEDLYQGKVGLVLKVAPGAFADGEDADTKFNGIKAAPGDWVLYSLQAGGKALSINGHHCRMIQDVHLDGRVTHPDLVM